MSTSMLVVLLGFSLIFPYVCQKRAFFLTATAEAVQCQSVPPRQKCPRIPRVP
jgi:hypothetical protein|eukprot:COSAG06_NODE_4462_length_4235_cov_16.637881_2_plen_53_part_00